MRKTITARRAVVGLTVACLLVATASCQSVDRAGGNAGVEPTALSFAITGDPPPQLTSWVTEVDQLSKGSLKIDFERDTRSQYPHYESGLIADVQAGKFDMAWVGARAFDRAGVTSFQALLAPMLVDSHELQSKVFETGIPDEMLAGLKGIDLVGVAIWPGPLRKVLGIAKPFTKPADFPGAVVGIQDSAVAELSFKALGASTKSVPPGTRLDGLDAYDQQLASIQGNNYPTEAKYVTGDLNLWPRPLVVFANPAAFQRLSDDQRATLRAAAQNAVKQSAEAEQAADRTDTPRLCTAGLQFAQSTPADLDALRKALQPVYDQITVDPASKAWLDRIQVAKQDLNQPPAGADCSDVPAPVNVASPYDGTYTRSIDWSKVDFKSCPMDPLEFSSLEVMELQLDKGHYQLWAEQIGSKKMHEAADQGEYRFFGNQMQFGDLSLIHI